MSCCCGGSTGRGCFQIRIDNITVPNPDCTGFDSHLDGVDLEIKDWRPGVDLPGTTLGGNPCTVFGRAGLTKGNVAHWALAPTPLLQYPSIKTDSSDSTGGVCYGNPDTACYWGGCRGADFVFVQDKSDYLYMIVLEQTNASGTNGDVRFCSNHSFHVIKSNTPHSDLTDLTGMSALSWTVTFYEFIDQYGSFTGWDEYFDPVLDFSSSTYTFTGCNSCKNKIPFAYYDSREDIDETLGKIWTKDGATPRSAAEMQALYFGTRPSGLDTVTSLLVGRYVPNGMPMPYTVTGPLFHPEFVFGDAQAGLLSVTYEGGDYTGPAPGQASGATQDEWSGATSTGPLAGGSRTLSNVTADNWCPTILEYGNQAYNVGPAEGFGLLYINDADKVVKANNPGPYLPANEYTSLSNWSPDIESPLLIAHNNYLHLNAHNIAPEGDHNGMTGYNPWNKPSVFGDGRPCYYRYAFEFEDGSSGTYFTSDRPPSQTTSRFTAINALGNWIEAALVFAVAETSDGANWDVYPCVLIQQRMPLFDAYQDWAQFHPCLERASGIECVDGTRGDEGTPRAAKKLSYRGMRECECQADLLSSRYESRVTYTVARATTPVTIASDSVANAVTKAMQGYTGSLSNWTAPVGFGLTGLNPDYPDRNFYNEWTHIPPAHGNSVFNAYSNISVDVGECDGINPCTGCKCPRIVEFNLPCLDDNMAPFNDLANGGACWQELKDRFMKDEQYLTGCEPEAVACEGCDGTKTVTATVGGTANSTCLDCNMINQTYVLTTQNLGNGILSAPTPTELSTYGAVCDGYLDTFYVGFCGGSPTAIVTVQVRIHEDGFLKCAVESGTSAGTATFSRAFSPGDYSPNCSINESWPNPDSVTGGLCDISLQTLSIVVS